MKKILVIIITALTLIMGSTIALAEGEDNLTPDQQKERDKFILLYTNEGQALQDSRKQTDDLQNKIAELSQEISDKNKTFGEEEYKSEIDEINSTQKINNEIGTQYNSIEQQIQDLQKQLTAAYKDNNTKKIDSINSQVSELNKKMEPLQATININLEKIKPLYSKVESYANASKVRYERLSPLYNQMKASYDKILDEEKEKDSIWNGVINNIKSNDYTAASDALQNAIKEKNQIIADLKAHIDLSETILKETY